MGIGMDEAPYSVEIAEGPSCVKAYWVVAEDNVRLRIAHWCGEAAPRGTVFVLQGRTENIEKYGRTADDLVREGFGVFAIDWRGQGLSDRLSADRMLGHVGTFSDYQIDLRAMIKVAEGLSLAKPWYLLGHSLGACVGLRAVLNGSPFSACAFTAPLWDINLSLIQRLAAWPMSWLAQAVGKGDSYAPGTGAESYVLHTDFDQNRLTHDPDMYRYYIKISEGLVDQQVGGPSMRWLYQALKETRLLARLQSPDVPCVAFCGAEDSIVAIPAVRDRMSRWPKGRLELLPNARHDVLYETQNIRSHVLTEICNLFSQNG